MATDLKQYLDFMEEAEGDGPGAGFLSPPMPSTAHPKGRQYTVPAPDALTGARLAALADLTLRVTKGSEVREHDVQRLRLDDKDEREFLGQCLGAAFEEMIEDGVAWPHVKRLGQYAFIYFGISEEAANEAAAKGLFSGKAPVLNRAARRSTQKKPRTTSASSGSKKAASKKASQ